MTLVMADKDQPVFRDFLGIDRKDEVKQQQFIPVEVVQNSSAYEDDSDVKHPTRASSGNSGRFETYSAPARVSTPFNLAFPSSSDPGSETWLRGKQGSLQHHGVKSAFYKPELENKMLKKRDSPVGRESLQERLQMSVEALENSRPKIPRLEQKEDKKVKYRDAPSIDELRLSMQPPRPSSIEQVLQTLKPDVLPRTSKKSDRAKPTPINAGLSSPLGASHLLHPTERLSAPVSRENTAMTPPIGPQAADEGSRTGMKGSSLAGLINTGPATPAAGPSGPNLTPRRGKVSSHSGGSSDALLGSRHQLAATPSRQLTVFYGGQAHVFDDVPPDKANQIMALAGANGRSWSTTYSPRQTSSIPNSTSDVPLAIERDREKIVNVTRGGGGSVSGGNLALSSEIQTLLRGLAQSGVGTGRPGQISQLPEAVAIPLSAEMQASQDWVAGSGCKRDSLSGGAMARATAFPEDGGKEALLRGQHWM